MMAGWSPLDPDFYDKLPRKAISLRDRSSTRRDAPVQILHPVYSPLFETFGAGDLIKPTVFVHALEQHKLDSFNDLFPDRSWRVKRDAPTCGLPYLESLTDLAVEDAFQKLHSQPNPPDLTYVVGESPQLLDVHANQLWNIESPTDDFSQYSTVRSCTHQLQDFCDCAGTDPDAYLLVHALYYFTPFDLARAVYRSKSKMAVSVHHPFHAAQSQLGYGEVNFNVAHGRVSTTRFPSYDRSDVHWLYTKDQFNFTLDDNGDLRSVDLLQGLPQDIKDENSIYTLYWEIRQDSKDMQTVFFGLKNGFLPSLPRLVIDATWKSLSQRVLGYGPLHIGDSQEEAYVEQIWNQVCLYVKAGEKRIFHLSEVGDVVDLKHYPPIPGLKGVNRPSRF